MATNRISNSQGINLDEVRYQPQAPGQTSWSLLLRWTLSIPVLPTVTVQLYADAALTQPLGNPTTAPSTGPGEWSPAAAGITLDPALTYWITVAASAGWLRADPLPVLWQPDQPTFLVASPGRLDIGWLPAPPPFTHQQLTLTSPGGQVLLTESLEPTAGLPGPDPGERRWRWDVSAVADWQLAERPRFTLRPVHISDTGRSLGPEVGARVLPSAPVVLSVAYVAGDVTSGLDYTLSLRTGAGAPPASFAAVVTLDGHRFDGPTLLADLAGPDGTRRCDVHVPSASDEGETLSPGAVLRIALAEAEDLSTGPYGPPHRLPITAPADVRASYDGTTATVSWPPVPDASGYRVRILPPDSGEVEVDATTARVTLPVQLPAQVTDLAAVVRVRTGGAVGPPSSPAALLPPAFFLSTAAPSSAYPHVFTATNPAVRGGDASAVLPALGGTPLTGLPVDVPPFRLEATTSPDSPYRLTVTAAAWAIDAAPIRDDVREAYQDFLVAVEAGGAGPAGVVLLQQVIARLLPQTFPETLYYGCGLDVVGGTVDLRPGTVLRITVADYVYVGQPATPDWVNGWTGGSTLDLEVGSYLDERGEWRVGFDPFVARLVASGALAVDAPPGAQSGTARVEGGVAAAADLFFDTFRQPFLRLVVPPTVQPPSGIGSTDTTANFVLAAAGSYATLRRLTDPSAADAAVAYLRGRTVVTPCVQVTVNETPTVLPFGTTVGNVLDRYGGRPPGGRPAPDGRLRLIRPLNPAVPAGPGAPPAGRRVRFDWHDLAAYQPGFDAYDLPLLPGDRLDVRP